MPDIIQLVPLCRVLDLSLQELLDGVEEGLGKQFISSLLIQQMDENKNINTETSNDHVFIRPQIHRQMPTSTYIFGHNLEHPYVKPTTKKFASFLKFFRAAAIAARSCSIRYSWLMLPFQISPFLKSPA